MVELEEIGPQLASLVVKIGGLPSGKAIDSLARAGNIPRPQLYQSSNRNMWCPSIRTLPIRTKKSISLRKICFFAKKTLFVLINDRPFW